MATLRPFAALRPRPELAARICELPYDVVSSDEARQMAAGNPWSFFRVSKPEIDLPAGTAPYAPEVYAKGQENFQRLIAQGALRPDPAPRFYLYRQIMDRHCQVGLVAAASCREYLAGIIKRHELTRPDKEEDRVRHIVALAAQTGPVFLVHRASSQLDELIAARTAQPPEIDFLAADGVRHSAWVVADAPGLGRLEAEFARLPALYIADGHHRCAAAARVYQGRLAEHAPPPRPDGESAFFLSVLFPHDQVRILPYYRVVRDLNGLSPAQLLERLQGPFIRQPGGAAVPSREHELALFLQGQWHTLEFRPRLAAAANPIQALDVALLQEHVLAPIFGIADPRTSKRLDFVGGIRGPGELERLVRGGEFACAFSLFPTSIEHLMTIADQGGLLPPKSTWFEPKLRDGLFSHTIGKEH